MLINGKINIPIENSFIGIDTEWVKNYKIRNGNIPFCFSIVVIKNNIRYNIFKEEIKFEYLQYYSESIDQTNDLIINFNSALIKLSSSKYPSNIICGHQLCSDLSTFFNYGRYMKLNNLCGIKNFINKWNNRNVNENINFIDTRYDLINNKFGKSRRLVDLCVDIGLKVTQIELGSKSMTKMYKDYLVSHDNNICEKLSILNLRHNLSTILLFILAQQIQYSHKKLNVNSILTKNLSSDFMWVNSNEFLSL